MTAHRTDTPTTEVYTSERARQAILKSGETVEEVIKNHAPFRTFSGLSTSVGHKLRSGEMLMLQIDAENNSVTVLHFSEFAAALIKQEFG